MNTNLQRHAFNAGIRIDAFGSPVVDRQEMLEEFVKNILADLVEDLPRPASMQVTISALRFGIKLKETK
jgi:hypothetical protein